MGESLLLRDVIARHFEQHFARHHDQAQRSAEGPPKLSVPTCGEPDKRQVAVGRFRPKPGIRFPKLTAVKQSDGAAVDFVRLWASLTEQAPSDHAVPQW